MAINNNFITSSSNVKIPKIIYGTAWKKEQTAGLVKQAIKNGFRGIDTACQPKHYNEAGVGDGVVASLNADLKREDLYLQSKFTSLNGQDPQRIPYDPKATLSKQVAQSFQRSLENLQTSYLDSLVLHSPIGSEAQMIEVWQAMEQTIIHHLFFRPGNFRVKSHHFQKNVTVWTDASPLVAVHSPKSR